MDMDKIAGLIARIAHSLPEESRAQFWAELEKLDSDDPNIRSAALDRMTELLPEPIRASFWAGFRLGYERVTGEKPH